MEACVAMTGCFGQEPVEFSVISDRVEDSGAYVWNLDGTVSVLENPLQDAETRAMKPTEDSDNDDVVIVDDMEYSKKDREIEVLFEAFCFRGWGFGCGGNSGSGNSGGSNCVQKSHQLDYAIAYDDTWAQKFGGNAQGTLSQVMAHVQTHYCHSSLGAKVKFNRVSNFKHVR